MKLLAAVLFTAAAVSAAVIPMDSARGDVVFQLQGCAQCHRLKGIGGSVAPDLGRILDRAYTPPLLAGTMWNHAPVMWSTIREKGLRIGDLDEQAAADLFASFYSARYFEMPGDAGRGKRLFEQKSCARCHGLTSSPNPDALPVNRWHGLADPVALVGAMWNHSHAMWTELSQHKIVWPDMTSQDLSDLLVYLRNASSATPGQPMFSITAGADGEKLFASKGCVECHDARRRPSGNMTLTGVAAAMWNHGSFLNGKVQHTEPPRLTSDEMREVVSVYWAKQFFGGSGNASQGKKIFTAKHCAECHAGKGPGPDLAALNGSYNGITMVSALWRHGPAMLDQMQQKHIQWPVFKADEMADLIAWLNGSNKK
jgi:mono/diheme cytochrome c family protein